MPTLRELHFSLCSIAFDPCLTQFAKGFEYGTTLYSSYFVFLIFDLLFLRANAIQLNIALVCPPHYVETAPVVLQTQQPRAAPQPCLST